VQVALDVAAALVHVQLDVDLAIVLDREQELVGVHDAHRAVGLDVAGVDRAAAAALDVQGRLVHLLVEHERERLEPLHDLVHVLEDALDRLVLVDDAIHAETPDRAPPQAGEQHPPEGVAERVAEPALERLEPELGGVRVVLPLHHLDGVRADEAGEVDAQAHLE